MFRNRQVQWHTSNSMYMTEFEIFKTQKLISASTRHESSWGSQTSPILLKYIYFDQIQYHLYSLGQMNNVPIFVRINFWSLKRPVLFIFPLHFPYGLSALF
jgi:hypothetical protein